MVGVKFDEGKPRIELCPSGALIGEAFGMTGGALKYDAFNWAEGLSYSRTLGAAFRHMILFNLGEDIDDDSGMPHLWHALCELGMLNDTTLLHPELDDRHKWPPEALARLKAQWKAASEKTRAAAKARAERDATRVEKHVEEKTELSQHAREYAEEKIADVRPVVLPAITHAIPPWVIALPGSKTLYKCVRCGSVEMGSDKFIDEHRGCLSAAQWAQQSFGGTK